jgi:hypothetical protein
MSDPATVYSLHVAELDAIAVELHLVIGAALEEEKAVLEPTLKRAVKVSSTDAGISSYALGAMLAPLLDHRGGAPASVDGSRPPFGKLTVVSML